MGLIFSYSAKTTSIYCSFIIYGLCSRPVSDSLVLTGKEYMANSSSTLKPIDWITLHMGSKKYFLNRYSSFLGYCIHFL